MRRLILVITLPLLLLPPLIKRDGRPGLVLIPYEAKFVGRPFTGIAIALPPQARIRFFWRGKQFGHEYAWYPNWRLKERRHFRNGLEHGLQLGWFVDGKPAFRLSYVDGKRDGENWSWHSNGQLAEYTLVERDTELAYRAWNARGKPFYNYVRRDGTRVGLLGETYCDVKR